jgi:hypothetical protein
VSDRKVRLALRRKEFGELAGDCGGVLQLYPVRKTVE